jgi:copper chaperone
VTLKTLSVPDISCTHCKTSIEGAVGGITGVADATVEIDARTVDVDFDPATVTLDAIIDAIEEQGYEVAR